MPLSPPIAAVFVAVNSGASGRAGSIAVTIDYPSESGSADGPDDSFLVENPENQPPMADEL